MRPVRGSLLLMLALVVGPTLVLGQTTRYVSPTGVDTPGGGGSPGNPLRTIQFAYDLSADGDEIRVLAGTYDECVAALDPTGRSIRIVAQEWMDNQDNSTTIVDGGTCPDPSPVITLGGATSTLVGFTIRNGSDSGVLAFGGPTITNNLVNDNSGVNGGGIYVYSLTCNYGDVTATITDNDVFNNEALDDGSAFSALGGGIGIVATARGVGDGFQPPCQVSGNPTIVVDNNHVFDNQAFDGGGIWVRTDSTLTSLGSAVTITNNLIENNQAGVTGPQGFLGWGGGIYSVTYGYGTEQINIGDPGTPGNGNTVRDNLATGGGGGIAAFDDTFLDADHSTFVVDNTVTVNQVDTLRDASNPVQARGGGIAISMRAIDLVGNQSLSMNVAGNTVDSNFMTGIDGRGGGLAARFRSSRSAVPLNLTISDNRFTNNDAVFRGGGVALESLVETAVDSPQDTLVLAAEAPITFSNNLVADNVVDDSFGGGIGGGAHVTLDCCDGFIDGSGACVPGQGTALAECIATMAHNTFTRNTNAGSVGSGGIEIFSITEPSGGQAQSEIEITNSIVASNTGFGIGGPPAQGTAETIYDIRWSDVWGNTDPANPADDTANFESTIPPAVLPPANGNLEIDPLLGPATANPPYAPAVCSPVIDAADPAGSFLLEPPPNGGRANMGYTGGTALATVSPVDLNGDGRNDGLDVVIFATTFGSTMGNPRYLAQADFDGSGMVDPAELSALLAGFGCVLP